MATYPMHIAGLDRDLPICKVTDDLYIGAFIMFGDAELTVRCAEELLKLADGIDYDYLFTAEAKSIPLIHEMARQSGAKKYFIARKGPKVYMPDPISVEDKSITTVAQQKLFLGSDDADLIRGKKILLVDDVISTGGSLKAMEALVEKAGGTVTGRMAVLAEGGAADRKDILFLEKLPVFNADGSVKSKDSITEAQSAFQRAVFERRFLCYSVISSQTVGDVGLASASGAVLSPLKPRRQSTQPAAHTAAMTARNCHFSAKPPKSPSGSFIALNAACAAIVGRMLPVR